MKRPIAPTTPIIKENFAVIRNELHDGHVSHIRNIGVVGQARREQKNLWFPLERQLLRLRV